MNKRARKRLKEAIEKKNLEQLLIQQAALCWLNSLNHTGGTTRRRLSYAQETMEKD